MIYELTNVFREASYPTEAPLPPLPVTGWFEMDGFNAPTAWHIDAGNGYVLDSTNTYASGGLAEMSGARLDSNNHLFVQMGRSSWHIDLTLLISEPPKAGDTVQLDTTPIYGSADHRIQASSTGNDSSAYNVSGFMGVVPEADTWGFLVIGLIAVCFRIKIIKSLRAWFYSFVFAH